jgi:hypothetical protein
MRPLPVNSCTRPSAHAALPYLYKNIKINIHQLKKKSRAGVSKDLQ